MFLLWLLIVVGIPWYYVHQADKNKKSSLEGLQNEMYNDQTGRASFTLTGRVPLFKEWSRFQPGYFRSSMFKTGEEVRAYMKEHPCEQYEKLESYITYSGYSNTVTNAFLLWMFSSYSAVHGHQSLNCVDIRTAYNVFCRFYGGKYESLDEPETVIVIFLRNLVLTIIFLTLAYWIDDIGLLIFPIAFVTIPIELLIMFYLEIKARREILMTPYDFVIEGMIGGSSADRIVGVYLGAQVARMGRNVMKKRW